MVSNLRCSRSGHSSRLKVKEMLENWPCLLTSSFLWQHDSDVSYSIYTDSDVLKLRP
jgi:hypothetical protein